MLLLLLLPLLLLLGYGMGVGGAEAGMLLVVKVSGVCNSACMCSLRWAYAYYCSMFPMRLHVA